MYYFFVYNVGRAKRGGIHTKKKKEGRREGRLLCLELGKGATAGWPLLPGISYVREDICHVSGPKHGWMGIVMEDAWREEERRCKM